MSEHKEHESFTEEFKVSGEAVVGKVKEIIREGNVRRIIIKNEAGKALIEIPLTVGVVGAVLLPVWAAIGAIAALAARLSIVVVREKEVVATKPPADAGSVTASGADTTDADAH